MTFLTSMMSSQSPANVVTTLITTTLTETQDLPIATAYLTSTECYYYTTIATRGQTIVFDTPAPSPTSSAPAIPTTRIYPSLETYPPTTTETTTVTLLAVVLQSPDYHAYSTWTIPVAPAVPTLDAAPGAPGLVAYVVEAGPTGWDSWSKGAKAGLIIGVVFAALLFVLLLICLFKKNTEWIAHDWRWARNVEGGPIPGANVVPTVAVNGPLDRRFATSYGYGYGAGGYGQGHPGWGWGMRGGAAKRGRTQAMVDWVKSWRKDHTLIAEQEASETNTTGDKLKRMNCVTDENDTGGTPAFYQPPTPRTGKHNALFEAECV
jgi:hypothetical protein